MWMEARSLLGWKWTMTTAKGSPAMEIYRCMYIEVCLFLHDLKKLFSGTMGLAADEGKQLYFTRCTQVNKDTNTYGTLSASDLQCNKR